MCARHRVKKKVEWGCREMRYPQSAQNEAIATARAVWTDVKLTGPRTQGTLQGYELTGTS